MLLFSNEYLLVINGTSPSWKIKKIWIHSTTTNCSLCCDKKKKTLASSFGKAELHTCRVVSFLIRIAMIALSLKVQNYHTYALTCFRIDDDHICGYRFRPNTYLVEILYIYNIKFSLEFDVLFKRGHVLGWEYTSDFASDSRFWLSDRIHSIHIRFLRHAFYELSCLFARVSAK